MAINSLLKFSLVAAAFYIVSCQSVETTAKQVESILPAVFTNEPSEKPLPPETPVEVKRMLAGAMEQTKLTKSYDPAYIVLDYPNGDVPIDRGVCTDVVIRAMRKAGVDLQKVVHDDMKANFSQYPTKWGLKSADPNIDHRRVPNLQTFFTRKGKSLTITDNASDYKPGDIVSWDLDGKGLTHIGLVSNLWSAKNKRYLIIHNIGGGAQGEDRLFDWQITGHYRYF